MGDKSIFGGRRAALVEEGAAVLFDAGVLVGAVVQGGNAAHRQHALTIGEDYRKFAWLFGVGDVKDQVHGIGQGLDHGLNGGPRPVNIGQARQLSQEEKEDRLAVGAAEDVAGEVGRDLLVYLCLCCGVIGDLSIVRKDPLPMLKGVAIEDIDLAGGGFTQVSDHGLRGDGATDPIEEAVFDGGLGALDEVGGAGDIIGEPPAIGVLAALLSEGVFSLK